MKTKVSFEYSPFRSEEERDRLFNTASKLETFEPTYHSVTFGAGGSTKIGTRETVSQLRNRGFNAVPHISWGSSSSNEIQELVSDYTESGIRELVVLRGDLPSGFGSKSSLPPAENLVALLRTSYSEDQLVLRVGCYPEVHPDAQSAAEDLASLKRKVDAGASECVTQYFYNVEAFEDFADRYAKIGINVPLVPGILPITNFQTIVRFSDKCGADVPRWLLQRMSELKDDAPALRSFGVEVVSKLCEKLIRLDVPELHFYTLNGYVATRRILTNLGY